MVKAFVCRHTTKKFK